MPVDFQHPEYKNNVSHWVKVQDCISGSDVIKSKTSAYLPRPDLYTDQQYQDYISRAVYTNYTARTLEGLSGAIFAKAPEVKLPNQLQYLIDNTDGAELSLEQMAKSVVRGVLSTGRHGILVDHPTMPQGLSKQQENLIKPHTRLYEYNAQSIINWKTTNVHGTNKLKLVVLQEQIQIDEADGFGFMYVPQWRVLQLDEQGFYQQLLYDNDGILTTVYEPRNHNGSRLNYIPFYFVGSVNNNANCDDIPLVNIADLNIAHYRNSADWEQVIYIVGQPTLFITSELSDPDDWQAIGNSPLRFGARNGYNLGKSGSAELIQAKEVNAALTGQQQKENQLIQLGARIIQRNAPAETATAAKIKYSSDNSILHTIAGNVSDGITHAMQAVCDFMGADPSQVAFDLNRNYWDDTLSSQQIMAQIQLLDRGIIDKQTMQDNLRTGGVIHPDVTNEDINNNNNNNDAGID